MIFLSVKDLMKHYKSRNSDVSFIFTNGCYDVFHAGHAKFLSEFWHMGMKGRMYEEFVVSVVGLDSDESVKRLKGCNRPVNSFDDRAEVLYGSKYVDHVVRMTSEELPDLIRMLKPKLYAKGGEYTLDSINRLQREALTSVDCVIEFIPMHKKLSSTGVLNSIMGLDE